MSECVVRMEMPKAIWKHIKTVSKHRWIVFRLMCRCGLPLQGAIHDLSKFSATEFIPSAKYFQGNRSPIEAEKEKNGYSKAWMHHKGHNPHHWEYWVDFGSSGEPIPAKIPYKYVIEMMCDYVAAGMTYSKEKWTQDEPLRYFDAVLKGRHFHPETERLLRTYLTEISKRGVERTCELAKMRFYHYLSPAERSET
jgi:hypothetical protein